MSWNNYKMGDFEHHQTQSFCIMRRANYSLQCLTLQWVSSSHTPGWVWQLWIQTATPFLNEDETFLIRQTLAGASWKWKKSTLRQGLQRAATSGSVCAIICVDLLQLHVEETHNVAFVQAFLMASKNSTVINNLWKGNKNTPLFQVLWTVLFCQCWNKLFYFFFI